MGWLGWWLGIGLSNFARYTEIWRFSIILPFSSVIPVERDYG